MKGLNKYNIEIYKLDNHGHEFDFNVDETFFEHFEHSPVTQGNVQVHVFFDKHETFIEANFHFEGEVTLTCDRSLELFQYPLDLDDKLIYKYGAEEKEIDDQIIIITKQTQTVNIAQFIYDTIGLSIPFKKLHPKYKDEEYENSDEGLMIYRDEDKGVEEEEIDSTDPRWDILKNLKNN